MKLLSKLVLISSLASITLLSANEYKMNFDKNTKGVIRHLLVYKNPTWVSKVVTNDSKDLFFTSPKSMLEFYFTPEKWPDTKVKTKEDIKDIIVTDYKTLKPIDGKYAFYIYGSNKTSPAGDDLPAFENINDAKEFMNRNNGKRILKFDELKLALIKLLNGDI